MTAWQRFTALWAHRYSKYSHIARKYYLFLWEYSRFSVLKWRLGRGRKLVAVLLSEQMGDIVAAEPLSREIRRLHPSDYIVWMVRKPWVDLVRYNPHLDGYLVEYCVSERIKLLRSGVFDAVYNLHLSHRNCPVCGDDHRNPVADRLGLTYENYHRAGDLLSVFSRAGGLPPLEGDPRLYIPAEVRQKVTALNLPEPLLVVHCHPSFPSKEWRLDHWNALVAWLLDTYPVAVAEVGLTNLIHLEHPRFIDLCGRLSVLETAEVVSRARLFIGIESGPAHFANASGTPGIILMGQLLGYDAFMPYSGRYQRGEGVTLLRSIGRDCSAIPFEEVRQTAEHTLNQLLKHEHNV